MTVDQLYWLTYFFILVAFVANAITVVYMVRTSRVLRAITVVYMVRTSRVLRAIDALSGGGLEKKEKGGYKS